MQMHKRFCTVDYPWVPEVEKIERRTTARRSIDPDPLEDQKQLIRKTSGAGYACSTSASSG
jgi:hypothetical protein